MGELKDRRARKKAQTRELIRSVAQRMIDERGFERVTIADIAGECDVAVQTVFNHFATKEELFFDGRTPWVESLAESVRTREPGTPPLSALRAHLVDTIAQLLTSFSCADRRRYLATLEASAALRAFERELLHTTELKLQQALLEAWADGVSVAPLEPEVSAPVIAAIWVAAGRSLLVAQRPSISSGADPRQTAEAARAMADRVLRQLELGANAVHGPVAGTATPEPPADTGWPQAVLRAG